MSILGTPLLMVGFSGLAYWPLSQVNQRAIFVCMCGRGPLCLGSLLQWAELLREFSLGLLLQSGG